jgi:hypothetical protein
MRYLRQNFFHARYWLSRYLGGLAGALAGRTGLITTIGGGPILKAKISGGPVVQAEVTCGRIIRCTIGTRIINRRSARS